MVMDAEENPLLAYFQANPGRLIDKWDHYFDIYHRHLQRFRGKPVTLVEIGVFHGGSLQMWKHYLGSQARIVGVDINPRALGLAEPGIDIVIGDQADQGFLQQLAARVGCIDVLVDDGGHTMNQQLRTVQGLYSTVADDGVVLVEDAHTSYWREYGGGYRHPGSFIEFAKQLVDQLNAWHTRDPNSFVPNEFTQRTRSIHFYDSVVIFEKGGHTRPQPIQSGTPSFEGDTFTTLG